MPFNPSMLSSAGDRPRRAGSGVETIAPPFLPCPERRSVGARYINGALTSRATAIERNALTGNDRCCIGCLIVQVNRDSVARGGLAEAELSDPAESLHA